MLNYQAISLLRIASNTPWIYLTNNFLVCLSNNILDLKLSWNGPYRFTLHIAKKKTGDPKDDLPCIPIFNYF
jgi:hypothetical protein